MLAAAVELSERTGHDFWGLLAELMHFNAGHFSLCSGPAASLCEDGGFEAIA